MQTGYGYDVLAMPTKKSISPFYFSVKVPDGNYKVTVVLGSKRKAAQTVVRAESRRLFVENAVTKKGKFILTVSSSASVHLINKDENVKIKDREKIISIGMTV